eukprot:9237301-Lingulodinium_polyedra.AAC.1
MSEQHCSFAGPLTKLGPANAPLEMQLGDDGGQHVVEVGGAVGLDGVDHVVLVGGVDEMSVRGVAEPRMSSTRDHDANAKRQQGGPGGVDALRHHNEERDVGEG